jgi:hypothetical protein
VQDYLSALIFRFAHEDLATRQRTAKYANYGKSALDRIPDIRLTCTNRDGHGIEEPRSTALRQVRIQLSACLQKWPGAPVVALEGGGDRSNRNHLLLRLLLVFHESHGRKEILLRMEILSPKRNNRCEQHQCQHSGAQAGRKSARGAQKVCGKFTENHGAPYYQEQSKPDFEEEKAWPEVVARCQHSRRGHQTGEDH